MTSGDLSLIEAGRLAELETTIEQGLKTFVEVGNALLEIRDSRLYRTDFTTFEEYCRERWGTSKMHAYRLMDAAQAVNNLKESNQLVTLPTNEAQARPLSKLSPQLQRTIWPIVVDTAPNGHITANHAQRVVDDYLRPDEQLDAALDDESRPVCAECGQVYDGDSCPDCSSFESEATALTPTLSQGEREENPYNYKRDNRRSVAADIYTPLGMDACQTPAYALDPLLPYLPREWVVWEPARGEGLLEDAFYDSGFSCVVSGDILTGQNFFDYEPERWDCLITNPPYSIQEEWLKRCYELDKPFALLLKVEVLGNKGIQGLIQRYGFEMLLLDQRVDFKMPYKGWDSSAQFPTFWLCRQLLPAKVVFGSIELGKRQFKKGLEHAN